MPLPNFIIIGAQKCGTSSLFNFLARHPDVGVSAKKEVRFFAMQHVWDRGVDWYASQFPDKPVRGEASPQYTWWPWIKNTPQRIADVVPDVKLIYMVRDPVERVVSQYIDWCDQFLEWQELSVALDGIARPHRYLEAGAYASQLEHYLEVFPRERILVLAVEDLARDPTAVMTRVHSFLQLADHRDPEAWQRKHNQRVEKRRPPRWLRRLVTPKIRRELHHPRYLSLDTTIWIKQTIRRLGSKIDVELPPEIDRHVTDIYRPEVERLRALTGESFECWARFR